jgi:hypothetical protein
VTVDVWDGSERIAKFEFDREELRG